MRQDWVVQAEETQVNRNFKEVLLCRDEHMRQDWVVQAEETEVNRNTIFGILS